MTNDQMDLFKQFMDFIQNVDTYKSTIESLQKATQDWEAATDALRQGQTLVAWKASLEADKAAFAQSVVDANESMAQLRKEVERKLADQRTQLANIEVALNAKAKDLDQREKQLMVNENDLARRLNDVNVQQSTLDAQEVDLQQREQQLSAKAAQIKQLVG